MLTLNIHKTERIDASLSDNDDKLGRIEGNQPLSDYIPDNLSLYFENDFWWDLYNKIRTT